MTKTFKKGDRVTFYSNWDRKGTVKMTRLTVHAAGQKEMTLVDDAGVKYAGHHFRPQVLQAGHVLPTDDIRGYSEVHHRMDDAAETALALQLGERFVAYERDHYARCLQMHTGPENDGYRKAITADLNGLHEPRAISEAEAKAEVAAKLAALRGRR